MGTAFTTAVGTPPQYWTLKFLEWADRLLAWRLAECPVARGTTYYVAYNAAGDGAGGSGLGTIASPYLCATPAHIQTLIASLISGGNKAFLLRDGDTWNATNGGTGISIATASVTLGRYRPSGSSAVAPPTVTAFKAAYAASGWTQVAGQNMWYRAETDTVKWVRKGDNPDNAFRTVAPAALTDANFPLTDGESNAVAGVWWHDTGGSLGTANRLYVRLAANADPNSSSDLQSCVGTGPGVIVSANGVRVDGIRADGWGMQSSSSQDYNFECAVSGTDCAVFSNLTGYWASSHSMGHVNVAGGLSTWINCRGGLCMYPGLLPTVWVGHTTTGGGEFVTWGCQWTHGALKDGTNNSGYQAIPAYSHTNSGSNNLWLDVGTRTGMAGGPPGNGYVQAFVGPAMAVNYAAPATRDDYAALRVFHIDEEALDLHGRGGTGDFVWCDAEARINSRYRVIGTGLVSTQAIQYTNGASAPIVNCDIEIDFSASAVTTGLPMGMFSFTGAIIGFTMWHSIIVLKTKAGQQASIDYDLAPTRAAGSLGVNTIFAHTGSGSGRVNGPANQAPTTSAGGMSGCGFFGFNPGDNGAFDTGHGSSERPVQLSTLAEALGIERAAATSGASVATGAHPQGWRLEYDMRRRVRGTSTPLGPIETKPPSYDARLARVSRC